MKKNLKKLTKKTKKYKLSNQAMFENISKTINDKVEDKLSKHDTNSSTNDIVVNSQNDKTELNKKIDDVSSYLANKVRSLETNDLNLLERIKDLDKRLTSTDKDLSDATNKANNLSKCLEDNKKAFEEYKVSIKDTLIKFDDKIDNSDKEIAKTNNNYIEFKKDCGKQLADLRNEQSRLNDEFEDLKGALSKSMKELDKRITSEMSIFKDDMKNNLVQIDSQIQNLLQESSSLRLKLDSKAEISEMKQLNSDISNKIPKIPSDISTYTDVLHKILNHIWKNTEKTKKEIYKMLMRSIVQQKGIKEVELINKYKIKFSDLKSLTIKYNEKGEDEMKVLISNSFPSQLGSFTFIGNSEEEDNYYVFNYSDFDCLESLQTTNSLILVQNYAFNEPNQLANLIQFFKKADTIEFMD